MLIDHFVLTRLPSNQMVCQGVCFVGGLFRRVQTRVGEAFVPVSTQNPNLLL